MDETPDTPSTADEAQVQRAQAMMGFSAGAPQHDPAVFAAQEEARQAGYRREQAMHLALQANGGGSYPVSQLVSDAETILNWLVPKTN